MGNTLIWILIGLVFFISEIYTPGFFLASMGLAAIITAIPTEFGISLTTQLIVFACALAASLFLLRPILYYLRRNNELKTNGARLIGKIVTVEIGIRPYEKGRVQVNGESWFAVCDEEVPAGGKVMIESIEGTVLVVTAVKDRNKNDENTRTVIEDAEKPAEEKAIAIEDAEVIIDDMEDVDTGVEE